MPRRQRIPEVEELVTRVSLSMIRRTGAAERRVEFRGDGTVRYASRRRLGVGFDSWRVEREVSMTPEQMREVLEVLESNGFERGA